MKESDGDRTPEPTKDVDKQQTNKLAPVISLAAYRCGVSDGNGKFNAKPRVLDARWKGGRPEITDKRAAAIALKRRWLANRAITDNHVTGRELLDAHRSGELARLIDVDVVCRVIYREEFVGRLPTTHVRTLVRVLQALKRFEGRACVKATHDELASVVGNVSERQMRRVAGDLRELAIDGVPLLACEPTFVCLHPHTDVCTEAGATHEQDGNAYVPHPALVAVALGTTPPSTVPPSTDRAPERAQTWPKNGHGGWPKNGQASGTENTCASGSSRPGPVEDRWAPAPRASTIAGHDAATLSTTAPPEAPDEGDAERMLLAELDARAAAGCEFSAELAAQTRRQRKLRAAGLESFDAHQQRMAEVRRNDDVFGKPTAGDLERDRGGAA